jgi:hypothetical protein
VHFTINEAGVGEIATCSLNIPQRSVIIIKTKNRMKKKFHSVHFCQVCGWVGLERDALVLLHSTKNTTHRYPTLLVSLDWQHFLVSDIFVLDICNGCQRGTFASEYQGLLVW